MRRRRPRTSGSLGLASRRSAATAQPRRSARLLSRPGEAIYNDQNGLVEGNDPFQVVWLAEEKREAVLAELRDRAGQGLGMAVAATALHALYPGVAGWLGPAVGAGVSLVVMGTCWWTMPANRLPVGVLILRVGMVAALVVCAFVARRVLFGRKPVLAVEVFALVLSRTQPSH